MKEFVSIVIPTLNSEKTLAECLDSIYSNKDAPSFEVLVIDGGSTDKTVEIAKNYPVIILSADKPQARQRNAGIASAKGDIIAFADSDVRVKDNWLNVLAKHFYDDNIAGVGGPNITPEDDPFWAKCFGALMESLLGSAGVRNTAIYKNVREVNHNPPVNAAIKKKVLLEVGGFNDRFVTAEDVELDARIKRRGYKLIYDPDMVVWHHRRSSLYAFIKQLFMYGRGRASVFLKYPESLPLTYYCVALFVIGTVLTIPVYLLVEVLRPVLLIGWGIYLIFILLSSFYIAIKRKMAVLALILPPLAIFEHLTLGAGFVYGLIFPFR